MNRILVLSLLLSQLTFAQRPIDTNLVISNPGTSYRFQCTATPSNLTQPLVIIDDSIVGSSSLLKEIDTAAIVSIEILKDRSARAAYGLKGVNGVIIIKTKRFGTTVVQDADNGSVLGGATVKVLTDGKSSSHVFVADKNGQIDISKFSNSAECKLEVSCVGYKTKIVNFVKDQSLNSIMLEKDYKMMADIIVVGYPVIQCRSICCICPSVITQKTIFPKNTTATTAQFSIYPNPVSRSGQLTIKLDQAVTGKIEIINSTGQIVQALHLSESENLYSTIQLNYLTPGCYFVKVSDIQTRKWFISKLVVR